MAQKEIHPLDIVLLGQMFGDALNDKEKHINISATLHHKLKYLDKP